MCFFQSDVAVFGSGILWTKTRQPPKGELWQSSVGADKSGHKPIASMHGMFTYMYIHLPLKIQQTI